MNATSRIYAGTPIEEMKPSIVAYNQLKRAGLNSVADVASCTVEDLRRKQIGERQIDEIRTLLNRHGRALVGDPMPQ